MAEQTQGRQSPPPEKQAPHQGTAPQADAHHGVGGVGKDTVEQQKSKLESNPASKMAEEAAKKNAKGTGN